MIKNLKYGLVALGFCSLVFSCKKDLAFEAQSFSYLTVSNQTTYNNENITLTYNNAPLKVTSAGFTNIKIPAGQGKLSFRDQTGNSILDTNYSSQANKLNNWILFQPVATVKPLVLENNQANEPKPEAGFIKVKAANFAPHIFPNAVDIVFYFNNPATNKTVPADTLENVPLKFGNYVALNRFSVNSKSGSLFILDSKTKQRLISRAITFNPTVGDYSVYTIYLVEDAVAGTAVTGSTSKVSIKTLFAN